MSFDGLSPHAALDFAASNFGFASMLAAERPLSPTNQSDGHDGGSDKEQLGGGQRRPHGRRPRKKGARRWGPGQFRVTEVAPQAQEHTGPGSHAAGHDMVGTEGQRGQLAGQVGGQALTDDEADHGQERHERPVERTPGVAHRTVLLMCLSSSCGSALLEQGELPRDQMRSRSLIVGRRERLWFRRMDGRMRRHLRTPRPERDDRGQRIHLVDRLGRHHQVTTGAATGSAAPSTTWLPQAAPAARGIVSMPTSAPV